MPSIPVVIATNGFGMPVKSVTGNAPVMTVATNGFGIPIVLSGNGSPFVVEGGVVPPVAVWILATGAWNDAGKWDDTASWKDS